MENIITQVAAIMAKHGKVRIDIRAENDRTPCACFLSFDVRRGHDALAEAQTTRKAVIAELRTLGLTAVVPVRGRGNAVILRQGFTNMGSFCTNAFAFGFRLPRVAS